MTLRSDATDSQRPADAWYEVSENVVGGNLGELLGVLRRRIGVLVGCVLLVTSVVLLVTFQLTPRYTATAQVLIDPRERNVTDLNSVVPGLSPESSTIESEVEVIRSRSLAEPLIEAMQLDRDPEFNPTLRKPTAIANALNWVRSLVPGQVEVLSKEQQIEREQAATLDTFSKALDVSRLGRLSFVISISVTSEDAAKAARIANTLSEHYLVAQLEAKFDATRRAADWLDERLAPLRENVRESERAVEAYRSEFNLGDDSRGSTVNEQQILEVNRQLVMGRADLAETRARFQRFAELLPSGGSAESVAEVLESNVIAELRQQQAELARKQADLASRYGDRHPLMINVLAERRDLEGEIEAEVSRIVANLENELKVAQSRDRSLARSLAKLQREAAVFEGGRIRLRELEREAEANRSVYEIFLSRFKETREQQGVEEADARIISAATVPGAPSFPNKPLNAALGFAASVLFGLGAVFVLERLTDSGFQTDRQLETQLGLPHMASIPELTRDVATVNGEFLSPQDYALAKPLSAYGEALRSLRAKLLHSDDPPKLILFTSAVSGEGKTTTAISLARAAAQADVRVLLIDADLRHPSVAKGLGFKPRLGLVEHLAGEESLEDVLLFDEPSGMQILPVASGSANPPDLLGSPVMRDLLAKLRPRFDLILIDSPPVLAVADAKVLGRLVDKVVFVVKWDETPQRASQDAVRAIQDFGGDIAGAIFSRLDLKRYSSYGYGHYYYHRYAGYYVN